MTFKRSLPPRRERPPDEFASFVPRPREFASLVPWLQKAVALLEPQARPPATKTAAECDYQGRVAALGCLVCRLLGHGPTPSQVHHVRAGVGKAQRAGHYCVIPLCEPHHTGSNGIHGDKGCLRQLNMTELDLLDVTIGEMTR